MHQPDYRDHLSGEFVLPWTYLHAIKDYTDMAYHLERHPKAKVTFNFVPVLLDQIEEYARQFRASQPTDPLWAMLKVEDMNTLSKDQRRFILDHCFCNNHGKMLHPFPPYHRLFELYKRLENESEDGLEYLSGQYMADLLVWFHLSWTGESVRRTSELVTRLMAKGCGYSLEDRLALYDLIGNLILDLIPRYRALAEEGRIEITTTPHFHPILPLMLDFRTAREAMPDVVLPQAQCYPGGLTRACRHIESAIQTHIKRFGKAPMGVWPAEGAVSESVLMLLARYGFRWAATGEGVLANSLRQSHDGYTFAEDKRHLYKPYRITDGHEEIMCFFRDDRLSDKIGFEYSKWHGRDAVQDFISDLERIWQSFPEEDTPVVSVILDGENAWEHYPYNGYYFLADLYEALENHPHIEMTTFSEVVKHCAPLSGDEELLDLASFHGANIVPENLPRLTAGSWVYGTFSTWIGDPAKNRAWDLLCEAKQHYDTVMSDGRLDAKEKEAAERQLADCEGSDWFWWFGDYNPSHSVQSFDRLYRRNLSNLYRLLKLPVPASLSHVISVGGGQAEGGGTMRRGSEH
ncbi:MAG: glycoside hydrolase family 57 protein [Methylophilaceae bacterium]|nr:glycoside hydrolase family 57 protein [Methylophilaceae bacterium]